MVATPRASLSSDNSYGIVAWFPVKIKIMIPRLKYFEGDRAVEKEDSRYF